MPKKESEYVKKSLKQNFSRILLTMKKEKGEIIRTEAQKAGKSMNAFIYRYRYEIY